MVGIVAAHSGVDRDGAVDAIEATLAHLAALLDERDAEALAGELPERFRGALADRRAPPAEPPGGRARELAAAVCRALAELLPDEVLAPVRAAAPGQWAGWLSPPAPAAEPRAHISTSPRTTLAEGRPGSSNPLSEAHPERAHAHSVVRADDPHEESKLSSAHDPRDEAGETLATSRSGSNRPVSEGKE